MFIEEYITNSKCVNDRVGLIGYSWGGLGANLLATKDRSRYHAVVSLDGSEQFHYYGNEDDEKLNQIRASAEFKPERIRAPYLYLDSNNSEEETPDSTFNIINRLVGEKQYLKILESKHEDFSAINVHVDQTSMKHHHLIRRLVASFLSDKLFTITFPLKKLTAYFLRQVSNTSQVKTTN
jgi:pimeloyl-ACP methyl ester carboxylesterase